MNSRMIDNKQACFYSFIYIFKIMSPGNHFKEKPYISHRNLGSLLIYNIDF